MSRTVDQKVVQMQFDNQGFEQGAKQTMSTLEKLKAALKFDGANKGVEELSKSVKGIDFTQPEIMATRAGFHIQDVFLKVSNVLEYQIARRIINIGESIAKSLTLDQVTAGFNEYQLKMDSINTIMASTGERLEVVNGYLEELNHYSDKTIYSFSDMTQNIGKFTNAGVKLDSAVKAIQGVANVAALSGANANEASRAMYNFAQALSAGYVKLIDWKSIENANMATVEFKDTLLKTAEVMGKVKSDGNGMYKVLTTNMQGKTMDQAISATKNFNDSLNYQWMTTDVLTQALEIYATDVRDMSDAEKEAYESKLKAAKFTDEQIKAFEELGIKATDSATKVRTFQQLFDAIKESIGSGWAMAFENVIGNLDEARDLLTEIKDVADNIVSSGFDRLNSILKNWKSEALGGRDALIDAFRNLAGALGDIIIPIKDVIRQIFPPTSSIQLAYITKLFRDWTKSLRLNKLEQEELRVVLHYLLTPVKILVELIKVTFKLLPPILKIVGLFLKLVISLTAGLIECAKRAGVFQAVIEKWHTAFRAYLQMSQNLKKNLADFAKTISGSVVNALKDENSWLNKVIDVLRVMGSMTLTGLRTAFESISNFSFSNVLTALSNMKARLTDLANTNVVVKILLSALNKLKAVFTLVGDAFLTFVNHIKENLQTVENFTDFVTMLWDAFKDGISVVTDFIKSKFFTDGPGLFEKIKNNFVDFIDALKGGLKEIPWAKLVLIGFTLALAACVINLVTAISKFGGLASALAQTITIINTTIKSFLTLKTKLTELSAIGIFILAITAAVGIISIIDKENGNLVKSAATLAILAGGLMILAEALLWINTKNALNPASLASLMAAIGALAGGTAILVIAAAALKDMAMSIEEALPYLKTLGVLMLELVAAMTVLTFVGKDHKVFVAGTLTIMSYASAVYILANALKNMADIKFPNIKNLMKVLAEVFAGFAAIMLLSGKINFGGDKGNFLFSSNGFTILAFAASLKIFAMGLSDIASLHLTEDAEKVLNMLKDLATKIIVFSSLVIVITKVFGKANKTASILKSHGNKLTGIMSAFALSILSISASLFIVAKAFEVLRNNLQSDDDRWMLVATLGVLAVSIGALSLVFKALAAANAKNPNKNAILKFALSLTLLTTALVPLALVLDLLSQIAATNDLASIGIATGIIVAMGLLMGYLMAMSGKMKLTSFKSILSVFAGMSLLLAEMVAMSMILENYGEGLGYSIIAFTVVVVEMGGLIAALTAIQKNMGHLNISSIIAIVSGITILAGVLVGLAVLIHNADAVDIVGAIALLTIISGGLILAIAALAGIKNFIGPLGSAMPELLALVGSIVALVGVLVGLAVTMKTYGEEIQNALTILGYIGLGLVAIMGILTAFQNFGGGEGNWATLLSLAGVMVAIAGALILMAQVPWDNLKNAAIVLGSLVVVMGLLAAGLGILNTVLPGSVIIFNGFAKALGVLAAGIGIFIAASGAFLLCVSKFIDSLREIGLCGDQVASGLRALGPAISDAIQYIAAGIYQAAPLIGEAIKTITTYMVSAFTESAVMIAESIKEVIEIITPALVDTVVTLGTTLINSFIESLDNSAVGVQMEGIGSSWIANIVKGLIPGYGIISNIGSSIKNVFLSSATPTEGEIQVINQTYENAYAGSAMTFLQATEKTITKGEKQLRRQAGNVPPSVGQAMLENAEKGGKYAKSAMSTIADAANAGLSPVQIYMDKAKSSTTNLWDTFKNVFTGNSSPTSLIAQFGNSITDWLGDKTSSLFDENGIKLTDFTDKLEGVVPAANAAGAAMEGAGKSAKKGAKGVKEAADEVSQFVQKMESSFNIFEEFKLDDDEENPLTGDKLLENMQSNIDGMTQWANEMVSLAGKMSEGLYKKLADMGPEGYKYVHAFASMTEEQLMQVNQLYAQSLIIPTSVTAQIYQGMATASSNAYTGFINGLNIPAMQMEGVSLATTFLAGVNDGLGIASPSKEMYDRGVFTTQGLTEGIKDTSVMEALMYTISNMCREILEKYRLNLSAEDFKTIGEQIPRGLSQGIESGQSGVVSSIIKMCEAAVSTAETKLEIHSPSRVFAKIGEFIDKGLRKGINENTSEITDAVSVLADETADNTKQALIDSDIDKAFEITDFILTGYRSSFTQDLVNKVKNYIHEFGVKTWGDTGTQEEIMEASYRAQQEAIEKYNALEAELEAEARAEAIRKGSESQEVQNAVDSSITTISDYTETFMKINDPFYTIGEFIIDGIKNGIEDLKKREELNQAITNLTDEMQSSINNNLQIASPSKVFAKIGGFIDAGLAKGISDNTNLVSGSMGKLADSAVDNMADAIATIQSAVNADMDVEPVIRPVVDLSNIQNGGRTINSLMRSNLGFGVNVPAANFMSSSETVNTSDNSDVVNAINSLKGDVISLKDSMANIKMVLDTGTLVGAMTPAMDKKLGIRKMYLERGM